MKKGYATIRKELLQNIRPSKEEKERFIQSAREVMEIIQLAFANKGISINLSVGGSIAKDTQLKGANDIDLFVRFPPIPYAHKDISGIAHIILKKNFMEVKRIHATRDYFHIAHNSILFEIIPVIEVPNASMQHRIMDASPHHVSYVKEKLKNNDEVRILKKFLKAQRLYGAESHIRGFSGYVCELLIIMNNSFMQLMKNAAAWNLEGEYFDMANHYASKQEAIEVIGETRHIPLIIIDPVQPNRNASASIDEKTYRKFIRLSQLFANKPIMSAFKKSMIRYKGKGIIITIRNTGKKDDTLPAKIRSLHERLLRDLSDFIVTGEEWDYDEKKDVWTSRIWLGTFLLPAMQEIQGPPMTMENSVRAFMKKHDRTIERDGRIYAIERRMIRTPEKAVRRVIGHSRHFPKRLRLRIERRERL